MQNTKSTYYKLSIQSGFEKIMLRLLTIIAAVQLPQINANRDLPIEHYYWRDYYGTIPYDAYDGAGTGSCGRIYIGQTLYNSRLIVGKICELDHKIYVSFNGKEISTEKDIKILCTRESNKLMWISVASMNKILLLTNRHFIHGGQSWSGDELLIGRLRYNSEMCVGKVLATYTEKKNGIGIYVTQAGKSYHFSSNFEVLSYETDARTDHTSTHQPTTNATTPSVPDCNTDCVTSVTIQE